MRTENKLDENDFEMMTYAKDRGEVYVEVGDLKRRAILVAWKPVNKRGIRQWDRARVQFSSGSSATVATELVSKVQQ